jgi:LysM repeat protein
VKMTNRNIAWKLVGASVVIGAANAPLLMAHPSAAEDAAPANTLAAGTLLMSMGDRKGQSSVQNAVYVVQAGDTLWSIAQRFYDNPLRWSDIYYANQSQIHDPNEIYLGQKLTIPQTGVISGTTSPSVTTNSTSATPAQASSPSSVTGYIRQVAQGTGLPESVVAAQVEVESNYDSGAASPAGAEGPYQFMPSTWATLGLPAGQEFDWGTSTQAYIAFMRMLLVWSGGNVRQALAAYNAGQGNWQAGLGYADQILWIAGLG